jgi:NAD-dependent protein deacetylases, SIR2 family
VDETVALQRIKEILKAYPRVVFLGGAGVSTASGIPDFRSAQGLAQLDTKYGIPYEILLSHSYFLSRPGTFYDFYWKSMVKLDAKPNKAHLALARYELEGHPITILTQNIDGLHSAAGSEKVYELHGSVRKYSCLSCGRAYDLKDLYPRGVPHCECGGLIKPDVVLYEESLNEDTLLHAVEALREAEVLIVGGTSLKVYPAAGLIDYFAGRTSILINREMTPRDAFFDYVIHDDVGTVLTEIMP